MAARKRKRRRKSRKSGWVCPTKVGRKRVYKSRGKCFIKTKTGRKRVAKQRRKK